MKKLFYARHGITVMNTLGVWSGTSETPLTKEGKKQAKKAGKDAKGLGIDYIACSPLGRAKETAKIIAKEIGYDPKKIHVNPLLIERHFGELEGQPWNPDLNLDGIADIETTDTILHRAKIALDWLHSIDAEHILVVSHGSFGRALRSHVLHDHPYDGTKKLNNAEIHRWI